LHTWLHKSDSDMENRVVEPNIPQAFKQQVATFLSLKHIAVVGISRKSGAGNAIYDKFKSAGYRVTPIHPLLDVYADGPCYKSISQMPEVPDGVFIMTRPEITLQVTKDCIQTGIQHIWMHNMTGTNPKWMKSASEKMSSVHEEAVRLAQEAGINVIAGGCPMQHIKPVDVFHKCIHWINERTKSI